MRTRFPRDRFSDATDNIMLPEGLNFSTGRKLIQKTLARQTKKRIIARKVGRGVVRYYADYHQNKNPWALWLEARRQPFGEVRVLYSKRADESLPTDFADLAEDAMLDFVDFNFEESGDEA
jgi:hypothetical protein